MALLITEEEGTLKLSDGFEVYTKTWKTSETPKAILIFIHGFSDHCNGYGDFFPSLARNGIQVHSFDQRGWGRSVHKPSEKGLTGPTTTVIQDMTTFIEAVFTAAAAPAAPFFLMGHSMGGAEVLTWIADAPRATTSRIRGFLTESAFVRFHRDTKPSWVTVVAGRALGKVLPRRQMIFKIDPQLISRDPATNQQFVDDPLNHDTGTLEGLAGNIDRAIALDTGKLVLPQDAGEGGKTRIWISHGTADGICDYHGSEEFFGRITNIGDKELKLYDGWYHRLHAEPSPDRDTFVQDVTDWIFKHLEPISVRSRM